MNQRNFVSKNLFSDIGLATNHKILWATFHHIFLLLLSTLARHKNQGAYIILKGNSKADSLVPGRLRIDAKKSFQLSFHGQQCSVHNLTLKSFRVLLKSRKKCGKYGFKGYFLHTKIYFMDNGIIHGETVCAQLS